MGVINSLLDPVLSPLLVLGPFWAILIISVVISLIITIAYKLLTDQEKLREIRSKNKEDQKRMKGLKDQPDVVMQIQKEMMQRNLASMKMSLKPTLFTFLPILIIFGWLNGHLLYDPISPGDVFTLRADFSDGITGLASLQVPTGFEVLSDTNSSIENGAAVWSVKAEKRGDFFLDVVYDNSEARKRVLVTDEFEYAVQEEKASGAITAVAIEYEKLRPLGDFSIFGWKPGWLGWYIILSLVSSLALRKLFRIQ